MCASTCVCVCVCVCVHAECASTGTRRVVAKTERSAELPVWELGVGIGCTIPGKKYEQNPNRRDQHLVPHVPSPPV
jgi:hypothetical protein